MSFVVSFGCCALICLLNCFESVVLFSLHCACSLEPLSPQTKTKRMALTKHSESPSRGAHAKLQVYEEGPTDFSISSSPAKKDGKSASPAKKKKIVLDHLCVDVPSEAMLRDLFEYFDKDGSGAIDLTEFRETFRDNFENFGAPLEDRDIDRLFERFDKGHGRGVAGDGKLHFDEFCVLILNRLRQ